MTITADEIAAKFIANKTGETHIWLSVKQTNWLQTVYEQEHQRMVNAALKRRESWVYASKAHIAGDARGKILNSDGVLLAFWKINISAKNKAALMVVDYVKTAFDELSRRDQESLERFKAAQPDLTPLIDSDWPALPYTNNKK